PGEYVTLAPSGRERRVRATPIWRAPTERTEKDHLGVDGVLADLIGNVESAASTPADERVLRLSGGKDSRLVLALIVAAGLQDRFRCVTSGPDHAADVVVARIIAAAAGVDIEVHLGPSTMTPEQFERQLRVHVFQTSGMLGAFTLK